MACSSIVRLHDRLQALSLSQRRRPWSTPRSPRPAESTGAFFFGVASPEGEEKDLDEPGCGGLTFPGA